MIRDWKGWPRRVAARLAPAPAPGPDLTRGVVVNATTAGTNWRTLLSLLPVLATAPPHGMTYREIAAASLYKPNTVRISVRAGVRLGLIELAGTRPSPHGNPATHLWRLTGASPDLTP